MIDIKTKLSKAAGDTVLYTLNYGTRIGELTVVGIDSTFVHPTGLDIDSTTVNTTDLVVDDRTVLAYQGIQIQLSGGQSWTEYAITITAVISDSSTVAAHFIVVVAPVPQYYYGAARYADDYFATRLDADVWSEATPQRKLQALCTATRAIERLNFAGDVAVEGQPLQFPRGGDAAVPVDLEYACYEEAISLLDGADSNIEQANLSMLSHGISSVRTTYDRSFVPENVRAGIMSYTSWTYLRPFLRDPFEVIVNRA